MAILISTMEMARVFIVWPIPNHRCTTPILTKIVEDEKKTAEDVF